VSAVGQRVALRLLAAAGWRLVYQPPPGPKSVLIFYPHTSNWDFVIGIVARAAAAFPVHWAGKDTLFRGPFVWLWRRLGGIPVNRRIRTGFVTQMAGEFARRPRMHLVIAPEGTRSFVPRWKSGFYHLAREAAVPLGFAFIDYGRREVGVLGYIDLSGDLRADMDRVREFYSGRSARNPRLAGSIFLDEETG
jgi:1-acyl-sn-glycerol-3-phosphate acyltransferase